MDAKLAVIIVHDLKNALAVLESELRALSDLAGAPDRERAVHAHDTCLALQEKLIGFLTLYKASSQGLSAQIDAVCPEDFLNAVIRQLNMSKPGVTVSLDGQPMPVVGFFDENLVGLALEAALQNALRFARSRIELGCRQEEGYLVFSVRDDGPGIGTKEETPSTGVGMDLCNVIGGAHDRAGKKGAALLRNHPAGGALFELQLP
ncbi:MAG TPA: HAMP domain-containing sensor histidine kinase [Noviherbaspirillum sp.]|nr:HAMP domain-containing sensor histidine kinase [Noviherbaspirillum sp.]